MEPIYSELAADADLRELLQDFVATIPKRIAAIRLATEGRDVVIVTRLVHQLRGACGSYGFHQITPLAAKLEAELTKNSSLDANLHQLSEFVQVLECLVAEPHPQSLKLV